MFQYVNQFIMFILSLGKNIYCIKGKNHEPKRVKTCLHTSEVIVWMQMCFLGVFFGKGLTPNQIVIILL